MNIYIFIYTYMHTAIGAAMLRGQGRLFAYDIDQARLRHLEAGAKRAGLTVRVCICIRLCLYYLTAFS